MNCYWEIKYFGTGMTPLIETFNDEAEARLTWDDWKSDPYKGASTFRKIEVIDTV